MRHINEGVYGLLMGTGIANAKPVGAGKVRANKGPALSAMASSGGGAADAREGGQEHPPIGRLGGARQPIGNSGKGRQVNAAAKFTGLHVVVDNSRCMPLRDPTRSAQRGSGIHLVLV
jgi:hypothetical protein